MKYVVATADEIPLGGRKIVEVAGRSIGVFNIDGEYFALRNRCPHQGGALCEGKLWGVLTAQTAGRVRVRAQPRDPHLPLARLGVPRAHRTVVV